MKIAEAACLSGLTIDTVRYYEKSGLLPEISRGADGQRRFTAENIDWLIILGSLRETGMSMNTMAHFASLYRAGDKTIPERREILLQHSERLKQKKAELVRCEDLLAHKLTMYDQLEIEPGK